MKVILLSDIDRVGDRGTVVNVKRGYARNYLLPRKLALEATKAQLAQLDSIKKQLASKEAKITKRLTDLAGRLGLVSVKTNDLVAALGRLVDWSRSSGVPLAEMTVRQPNLEDVFLSLTGRRLRT